MSESLLSRFLIISRKNSAQGFTLIELLVVIIILGILAAIAIPNYIRQAGKAREVEMKNTVGSLNRAQQAYHWEKQVFASGATDAITLNLLNISFNNRYIDTYNFQDNNNYVTVAPANFDYEKDQTRSYSGGTYFNAGIYTTILCQSYEVSASVAPPTSAKTCDSGSSEEIK